MTESMQNRMSDKPFKYSDLTEAIAKFLVNEYGYPVYREYPEEGLEMPCFVLRTSGGNNRPRIRQGYAQRYITYERMTLEFYTMDIVQLHDMAYELRMILDVVETDNGNKYRCYNKNAMLAITEHHVSLTFRVHTEPYIENEPDPRMLSLNIDEKLT